MSWPTTKEEFMQRVDELIITLTDDMIRDEDKMRNKILINAYLKEVKKYMGDGEE